MKNHLMKRFSFIFRVQLYSSSHHLENQVKYPSEDYSNTCEQWESALRISCLLPRYSQPVMFCVLSEVVSIFDSVFTILLIYFVNLFLVKVMESD